MMGMRRAGAYSRLFLGRGDKPHGDAATVLGDLERFCYATRPTFDTDPLIMAEREGRREVFNRIMTILNFNFEQYYQLRKEAEDERRDNDDY